MMNKGHFLGVLITVTLLLTLAYQAFPVETKATTQMDGEACSQEALLANEQTSIEIANLSNNELSALGSAVNKVLQEEMKRDGIRKIALARAQQLAGEAEDVGGLFAGFTGFFRKFLSSLGWIKFKPPENVVTLSIESEAAILSIGVVGEQYLVSLGPVGVLGAAIVKVLTPGAKWLGKEWAEWLSLRDIGYFTVTKPGVGTMDVIYDKGTKEACVNVHLEDLEKEWKKEYGWEDEHIYMYVPFDEEPPKLKKTGDSFDYKVVFKAEALTRFEAGDILKVTNTGDSGLRIHKDDPTGETLRVVPDGWTFRIIGGPQYNVEGHNWWKIREENYESFPVGGWVAEDFLRRIVPEDLVASAPPEYSKNAQDKVEQAIEWATASERTSKDWRNLCLRFVANAFGEEHAGYHHPNELKNALGDRFYSSASSWNPPRGALIFFSGQGYEAGVDYTECGHIGIYLGNGEVVHAYGEAKVQKFTGSQGIEKEKYIGSYVGWSYPPEKWRPASEPMVSHPWPMFGHDAQNTFRSPFKGPESPMVKWVTELGGLEINPFPLISADGAIYLSGQRGDFTAIIAISPQGEWKELVEIPGKEATLLALGSSGTFYLMQLEGNRAAIVKLDSNGKEIWRTFLPLYSTQQIYSYGTIIGPDQAIYAIYGHTIYGEVASESPWLTVLNHDGNQRRTMSGVRSLLPAVAPDGTVYVVTADGKIRAYDSLWIEKWQYDGRLEWPDYYDDTPYWISVGPDGTVYILPLMQEKPTGGRLVALAPSGTKKWHVDFPEPTDIYAPPAIALDGFLYLALDLSSESDAIFRVSPDGNVTTFGRGYFTVFPGMTVIDAVGTVYVGQMPSAPAPPPAPDPGQSPPPIEVPENRVIAFNPDGSEKWILNLGPNVGSIYELAMGADGAIYAFGGDFLVAIGSASSKTAPMPSPAPTPAPAPAPAPAPGLIHVDDDSKDYPNADFAKIQDAVDAASTGDTIIVYPGTYTENLDVSKDQLTIKSESGADSTIVQAMDPDDHIFEIKADHIEIQGLTIQGATGNEKAGIYSYDCPISVSDLTLSDNNYGIYAYSTPRSSLRVSGSVFSSNNRGICSHSTFGSRYGEVHVSDSTFSDNDYGIYTSDFCGVNISNSAFSNNDYGIYGDNRMSIHAEYSTFSNNTYGIYGNSIWGINSSHSNFYDNDYGVYAINGWDNTLSISYSNFRNNRRGIYYQASTLSSHIIFLNNFIGNTSDVDSSPSKYIWNSAEQMTYTYNGKTYTSYLGNYWSDYSGSDTNGDGIGDAPYRINSERDDYPLMKPWEN